MKTSSSVYLISALTIIVLSQPAISPAAAQSNSTSDESSVRSAGAQDGPRVRVNVPEVVVQGKELESILGREVRTRMQGDVGRIIDLLANRDGQVQAAVVELGGFLGIGSRKIAVEWSALRFETRERESIVILEMNPDQLRRTPAYKPSEPVVVRQVAE